MWNFNASGAESAQNGTLLMSDCGVQQALGMMLTITLVLVVFSLGCSVEAKKVWLHIQRPWAILVGLLCQFVLMPFMAYLFALGFSVTPMQAVAIVIVGSSPGGTVSNIITYWLDGDMDLSVTMTSVSTLLGLGVMPLCLYIYTYSWFQRETLQIPYLNIGITSITLIIPVIFGVLVNYKWPKVAKVFLKIGSSVGGLVMLAVGISSFVLCEDLWSSDVSLLIIGAIFAPVGYLVGLIFAIVVQQPWNRCRTIAMETGAQNMQVCGTVLQLFFPESDVATLPVLYFCFQILSGFLLVIVFQIYKNTTTSRKKDTNHRALPQSEESTLSPR
ncbi:sodium-dependent organic anion transporter-like [Salminus brasiliensis]|uniref:sodium-dependent organic anion transporter-like n=1 Tax=Salminus brasiliensis TaxID=930266 RepID=UPI003B830021